ncbi:MAG: YggT family protein [Methylococcales bacterium]
MNSNYLTAPIIFLIGTLFYLYILAVLLRFLLQYCGSDFYNPISQFLIKITHPPLKVLRRYIPAVRKIDTSSLVLVFALQMLADFSIGLLKGDAIGIASLAILSTSHLIELLIDIFIYAVFIRALLTWFSPVGFDAVSAILTSLTEPLLNTCRKFIPYIGGVDLSSLAVLLFLYLAKLVVLLPLYDLVNLVR